MRLRVSILGALIAATAAGTLVASGVPTVATAATHRTTAAGAATAGLAGSAAGDAATASRPGPLAVPVLTFSMVRSAAAVAARCLVNARATVQIQRLPFTEVMIVTATGLPRNTGFDLFILQVPNAPFGVSWYQGDLRSNANGVAQVAVIGRFNIETFAVAPGVALAPNTHPGRDAIVNPAFGPIHTYHVGFWFDSPRAAVAAGCAGTTTPFNGNHTAGVQAMSTRTFPDRAGPLSRVPA